MPAELGFITKKNRLNPDAASRLPLDGFLPSGNDCHVRNIVPLILEAIIGGPGTGTHKPHSHLEPWLPSFRAVFALSRIRLAALDDYQVELPSKTDNLA